ncbi:MAG: RHS repeat protein, partial [Verrucomicrobia bacterium]|nr:RHS repeat protein [Leptolyngbya sp. ES-bin-22]
MGTVAIAANGQERTVTDERGLTHSTYDERGRLLAKVEPDGRS